MYDAKRAGGDRVAPQLPSGPHTYTTAAFTASA
jgi:hypothetical protein